MFFKRSFQKNRELPNKSSILNTWFFSYVAVLALIVALIIASESMYMDFIRKIILQEKETQITAFSESMDLLTEECELFAMRLAGDKNFKEAYMGDLSSMVTHLRIGELTDSYKANLTSVDEYYVYVKNSNAIINSKGFITNTYEYYNFYYANTDLSYNDWLNEYLNCRFSDYHVYLQYESANAKKNISKFCYTLPMMPVNGTEATIVVIMDADSYMKKLQEMGNNIDMSILIYADNGNRYFSLGDSVPSDRQLSELEKSNGFIEGVIDGKKVVMNKVGSNTTSWKYAFVVPRNIFWDKAIIVKRLSIIVVLLIAVLGLAGVYLITRYNYKSMADIIKKIEKKISAGNISSMNEYEIISHVVDVTSQLSDKVKKQEIMARNSEISALMLGISNYSMRFDTEKYIKMFASNYYISIVFSTAAFDKLFESENMSDSDRLNSMNFIIRNIFTELMEPYGSIDYANMENITFLFSPKCENLSLALQIAQREAEKTVNAVYEYFDIEVICGVSNLHESVVNISVTYIEALSAVNKMSVSACKGAFLYSEIEAAQKNYYYSTEQEQRLISLLSKGEYEDALSQINDVINMNTNILSSKNLKQALLTDIAGTIIKVALRIGYNIDGEQLMQYIQSDLYSATAKLFSEHVDGICKFIHEKNSCHPDILIEKADKILKENFRNVDFNVAILADMLDISANYLSTVYKKKTNENLLDKIRNMRVEEAKILIKESAANFEQIAKLSGFGSITTFNRVFKKTTGMSPGQYRDL